MAAVNGARVPEKVEDVNKTGWISRISVEQPHNVGLL